MIGHRKKIRLASGGSVISYSQQVVADNPSAYWPMDDPSGTIARDVIGTRHATISNGVLLGQSGGIGGMTCAVMPSDTLGQIAPPSFPPRNNAFSLEIWVKPSISGASASHRSLLMYPIITDGDFLWYLVLGSGTIRLDYFSGAHQIYDIPANLVAGIWSHYVLTIGTGQVKGYINAVPQTPLAITVGGVGSIGGSRIGCTVDAPNWGWIGSVQAVAFYSRVLTLAEIQSHYALR